MIALAIREQLAVLVLVRATTPSEVTAPEQADPSLAIPMPNTVEGPSTQLPAQMGDTPSMAGPTGVSPKGLQDVQYQVMGTLTEEQASIPFTDRR
ncbi:UNVERIFIED_CONTAM: hypothetical protein Slati_3788600 [Sesamum latifolium]|uniref:Uncharacterized protein n=1 Tax=Sesamum latifolium TaxID=2727402 RepID=A0AAW2U4Y4_9LAMI